MPPGNYREKAPVRVVEKVTAEAALAIARRVELDRLHAEDPSGSEAARQVAAFIQQELLRGA